MRVCVCVWEREREKERKRERKRKRESSKNDFFFQLKPLIRRMVILAQGKLFSHRNFFIHFFIYCFIFNSLLPMLHILFKSFLYNYQIICVRRTHTYCDMFSWSVKIVYLFLILTLKPICISQLFSDFPQKCLRSVYLSIPRNATGHVGIRLWIPLDVGVQIGP